tara:strand:- start:265 stop:387 length:123 start_codon:yes stop_codon:yes gene_type:complete
MSSLVLFFFNIIAVGLDMIGWGFGILLKQREVKSVAAFAL